MDNQEQEGLNEVSLRIQAVNITVDDDFKDRVSQALAKLRRYYSGDVISAEVFMREEAHGAPNEKSLRISFGVPGSDVFAEETGSNWDAMLNSLTGKLKHQLDKKFVNSQNSYRHQ